MIEVRDRSRQLAIVPEAVGLAERDVADPVMMEPNLAIEYHAQN